MAARDAVKCVPEITRNHCPNSAKCALKAMREEKADGMIVLMAKFCEPHMYYYPEVKEGFEKVGMPHLLIETEHEAMPIEALKTRVETFLEIIKRREAA